MYKQQADSTNDQLINLSRAPYSHAVTHQHTHTHTSFQQVHWSQLNVPWWKSSAKPKRQHRNNNPSRLPVINNKNTSVKATWDRSSHQPQWTHVNPCHPASLSAASWLMKSAGIWRRSCPREQSEQYSLGGVQAVKVRWHLVPCRQHQNQSMQGPCELLNTVAGIISSIVGTPDAIYQPDTCIAVRKQGWSTKIIQDALFHKSGGRSVACCGPLHCHLRPQHVVFRNNPKEDHQLRGVT